MLYNGNRTERSPNQAVIIGVINKIYQPHGGSPISLFVSTITDAIGWHEVLLTINHIIAKFKKENGKSFQEKEKRKKKELIQVQPAHYATHARAYCQVT